MLCRWITRSKLGRVLEAIRDGENRVRFSGYSPVGFKLFVFVVAAAISGIARRPLRPQVGIINPSRLTPPSPSRSPSGSPSEAGAPFDRRHPGRRSS